MNPVPSHITTNQFSKIPLPFVDETKSPCFWSVVLEVLGKPRDNSLSLALHTYPSLMLITQLKSKILEFNISFLTFISKWLLDSFIYKILRLHTAPTLWVNSVKGSNKRQAGRLYYEDKRTRAILERAISEGFFLFEIHYCSTEKCNPLMPGGGNKRPCVL